MTTLFTAIALAYATAMALRIGIAWRWLTQHDAIGTGDEASVTVLIPVLSGDPALEGCLAANLANAPDARFVLLIDDDDPVAQAIAADLDAANARVEIGPPPAPGENPKVAKLARALPSVATGHVAVLDDDTVLPPGALARALAGLDHGDLVTGLPVYDPGSGVFTRLLAAFVNASVLITYPVGAALGQNRTLNGMFYLTRTEALRGLGGFAAIRGSLTDDYAMARLYLDADLRLVQSRITHKVQTTVTGPVHYLSVMRRWMIFARHYLRDNPSVFTLGLIGGTSLAPPLLLLLALMAGSLAAVAGMVAVLVALLGAKTAAVRHLRARRTATDKGLSDPPGQFLFEMLADLLLPLHMATALFRSGRFHWRRRRIVIIDGQITYD